MTEKTFQIVHNIPSPYRLHMFSLLNKLVKEVGLRFHVHFMAVGHSDRQHWNGLSNNIDFPHTFWRDYPGRIGNHSFHFNTGIMHSVASQKVDFLMLGGIWDSITNTWLALNSKANKKIAWIEGNRYASINHGKLALAIKRRLIMKCTHVAVPGQEGKLYLKHVLGDAYQDTNVLLLPNIIDEATFSLSDAQRVDARKQVRSNMGMQAHSKLAIWPARLIPSKGVKEFLSLLSPSILDGWQVIILGEGPLHNEIETVIGLRSLERHVRVVPYVSYKDMPFMYASADLFLLPSLADPNPLSVVEAMFSRLPVLVSTRIGNYSEALVDRYNGWGVDPANPEATLSAIRDALALPFYELKLMGERSQSIAENHWDSNLVLGRFLSQVLEESNSTIDAC